MCTNRVRALDPALKRRAADILIFERPDDQKRRAVLAGALDRIGFSPADVERLVAATGAAAGPPYGFTFSDFNQRLVPAIVLDAYPSRPVDPERAIIADATDDEARVRLIHRLEGLHSFNALINRTRRRDIGAFTTRTPRTVAGEFTAAQSALHDAILAAQAKLLARVHGSIPLDFF